jgi:nucleoid-associated protein YgaU
MPFGMEEPTAPAPETPRRSRRVWVVAALVLVAAAIVGIVIGTGLGLRQAGPLAAQSAAGGRPTIVISTASAAPAASVVPSPSAPIAVPSEVAATSTEYVVQPGDTLRSIAEDQYGDASQWPRIYDANRDVIGPNPDALVAGTKLVIPR